LKRNNRKLKEKKENMNVRELFRNNLENSEVIPGDSVRNELMKRLGRKEFVRFNPSRFNVYYLGGIAAAVIVSAIMLTTGTDPGNSVQNINIVPENEISDITDSNTFVIPVGEPARFGEKKDLKVQSDRTIKNERSDQPKAIIVLPVIPKADIKDSVKGSSDILPKSNESINNRNGNYIPEKVKVLSASYETSVISGCSPLKVRFMNHSVASASCQWQFGDGGFSSEKDPEWIFDVEGDYKIVLKVQDSIGRQETASTIITVHPKPVARFESVPDKPVLPDDNIRFLNYSTDAVRYRWDFGDGKTSNEFEPDHKYMKYGNYNLKLIAWSNFGCSDTMLVKNAFSGSGCFIEFPNAFIPGTEGPVGGYYSIKSDESARIFHPTTSGVAEYHLKIFSKLGILIFESNDINIGWDGYFKGQLCEPGVYIWKVRGAFKNGEPFVKMGDITLLKN
jgi:PKD repeat protein